MEQRYQAVLAVIRDGESIVDVASRVGVSRQTVHAWLARYEAGGLAALAVEFATGRSFASIEAAQAELDAWVADYNHRRPHQGIGMDTPAARFGAGTAGQGRELGEAALRPERIGGDWISRRVCSNGVVSVAWQQFSVGKHRAGASVDIHVRDQILQVWDGEELLKTVVRDNQKEVRKKRASVRRD